MIHIKEETHKLLQDNCCTESVYKAIERGDSSEIVLAFMDNLTRSNIMRKLNKTTKSETKSNILRSEGNRAYTAKNFRKALELYNKALLYAPENSDALKLAFSNRSALLFTTKMYSACVNDIETYFSLGCTDYVIAQRLVQRKQKCIKLSSKEEFEPEMFATDFIRNFFNFNVSRHSQIPCVSTDVDVIMDSGLPKVVAASNIPVGTVVAVEPPFIAALDPNNYLISCHYCHKLTMNLIPCNCCCVSLFCNEECKRKCNEEFHSIECKIIDYDEFGFKEKTSLIRKAVIKLRKMCKSWNELITESNKIGIERLRESSLGDIYNVNSKFTVLNTNVTTHFIHAERFNSGLASAIEIEYLKKIPFFLPKPENERIAAIRALAKIMMHFHSSNLTLNIWNSAKNVNKKQLTNNATVNYGWYAFTGKLKHCCDPNLLALGLGNNIALIALKPIKKGSELNISYVGHYYDNMFHKRQQVLYRSTKQVCHCRVCTEGWSFKNYGTEKLTDKELKTYTKWVMQVAEANSHMIDRDEKVFKATCIALKELQNAPNTEKHYNLFREFQSLLGYCQIIATGNTILQS